MNLENILDKFSSNPLLIVVAIIIYLLPIFKFFKEIFIDFEISRFKKIINTKNYEDGLSEALRNSLIDERDRVVFDKIYGLNLNKKYRDTTLKIINHSNTDIEIKDIRRASDYISFKDNHMIIKYRPWLNTLKKSKLALSILCYSISIIAFFIVCSLYINIPYATPLLRKLAIFHIGYYIFIVPAYLFLTYNQLKKEACLASVIRILAQAHRLPQYIKVDEDWWFKETLRKVGIRPKSFAERDFDTWAQ